MNAAADDRYLIIAALLRHRVRFVVIGGFAAQMHCECVHSNRCVVKVRSAAAL